MNLWTDLSAERPDYGGAGRTHIRADGDSRIASTSHPANQASRGGHRAMSFCPLPSWPLIQHLRLGLRANLAHDHVPAHRGRPAKTMLDQIADRLRATERKHPAAVHPIRWAQEDDLLEQYLLEQYFVG